MQSIPEPVLEKLREAAGPGGATNEPNELAPYLEEWRGRWHGRTPLMLSPTTTEQVAKILKLCFETRTPIVPQGGNTGLVGGQVPTDGEVLLSLRRMNRIRSVSPRENVIVAEAGVVLAELQKAAAEIDRLFPLSLSAEGSCTIGGNLSTNAGGINVLHYGMSRALTLGLEVVLADGRVLDLMRALRKDNTGYDLKQLFVGAEGTLGVITAAALKLFPKPAGYLTAFTAISGIEAALDLLNRVQAATAGLVTAFELIPRVGLDLVLRHISGTVDPIPKHEGWFVLIEVSSPSSFDMTAVLEESLSAAMGDDLVLDAAIARSARDRQAFWRLRESLPEAQRLDGVSISNDLSVPSTRIPELIDAAYAAIERVLPGARPFSFGHVGDGNIHLAVRAPEGREDALLTARERIEAAIQDVVDRFGGSISAEHGLGLAKNAAIARYKEATEIEVMRALKAALDPRNILNPGKLLPNEP